MNFGFKTKTEHYKIFQPKRMVRINFHKKTFFLQRNKKYQLDISETKKLETRKNAKDKQTTPKCCRLKHKATDSQNQTLLFHFCWKLFFEETVRRKFHFI